jgi:hypothetical protein
MMSIRPIAVSVSRGHNRRFIHMKEPPMDLMQLIAKDIADTLAMMKQHLADFSDADMLVRPVPNANHANWQVGHLLGFEVMVANLIGAKDVPALADNFKSQYNSEAAKSDDAARSHREACGGLHTGRHRQARPPAAERMGADVRRSSRQTSNPHRHARRADPGDPAKARAEGHVLKS